VLGVTFSAIGASGLSASYLLATGLQKIPSSQLANQRPKPPALNSSAFFTNPKNGRQGVLVRLPQGQLFAYDRACTHVGVYVYYDPKTHYLVCPAHQALFDPAQKGRVISGPAPLPLPQIPVHPQSDGTLLIGEHSAFPAPDSTGKAEKEEGGSRAETGHVL
jgi:Rieske Fe-S protein